MEYTLVMSGSSSSNGGGVKKKAEGKWKNVWHSLLVVFWVWVEVVVVFFGTAITPSHIPSTQLRKQTTRGEVIYTKTISRIADDGCEFFFAFHCFILLQPSFVLKGHGVAHKLLLLLSTHHHHHYCRLLVLLFLVLLLLLLLL